MAIDILDLSEYPILYLCDFLSHEDRVHLAGTCRKLYDLITSEPFLFWGSFPRIPGQSELIGDNRLNYRCFVLHKRGELGDALLSRILCCDFAGNCILADEQRLAKIGKEGAVQVWNLADAQTLTQTRDDMPDRGLWDDSHEKRDSQYHTPLGGTQFLFYNQSSAKLDWHAACRKTFKPESRGMCVRWQPTDYMLVVWKAPNFDEPIEVRFDHEIRSVIKIDENRLAVLCRYDELTEVNIYDIAAEKITYSFQSMVPMNGSAILLLRNGSSIMFRFSKKVCVCSLQSEDSLREWTFPSVIFDTLPCSKDRLVVGLDTGSIYIFSTMDTREPKVLELGEQLHDLKRIDDDRFASTSDTRPNGLKGPLDVTIRIWRLSDGECLQVFSQGNEGVPYSLFLNKESFLASYRQRDGVREARIYNLESGDYSVLSDEGSRPITDFHDIRMINSEGVLLAFSDGRIFLFNLDGAVNPLILNHPDMRNVKQLPDGRIATISDKEIRIWGLSMQRIEKIEAARIQKQ